ncbi:hypothetical protein [Rhodococcus jostii]|uniref:hypothetical protein n=1 Tax=Rhodococcus jostii TaxID=132919 RepID=UPI001F084B99|nr:hypothetical protein [Rhodococcus jostii]
MGIGGAGCAVLEALGQCGPGRRVQRDRLWAAAEPNRAVLGIDVGELQVTQFVL